MKRISSKGFTLIELMIVVAIIGILIAIAYPNYIEYVRHSARSECEGTMLAAANMLERRFSSTNTYLGNPALPGPASCPADGGTATYTLGIGNNTATTFTITASPTGSQASDSCGTLSITNAGVKTSSAGSVAKCWH